MLDCPLLEALRRPGAPICTRTEGSTSTCHHNGSQVHRVIRQAQDEVMHALTHHRIDGIECFGPVHGDKQGAAVDDLRTQGLSAYGPYWPKPNMPL